LKQVNSSFFEDHPVDCAKRLIGAELHWDECSGLIVETEAYTEKADPACHTFFRPSARAFVERESAGTAYVYLNYGVHWLFNILVKGTDGIGFVLLRALEPKEGIDQIRERRQGRCDRELCSGPGRLTQALGIDGEIHGEKFLCSKDRGIRLGSEVECLTGSRIGISRGQDLPWRFGMPGSRHLSKPFPK
jgi:DNA-3-methyladenine glycosylase